MFQPKTYSAFIHSAAVSFKGNSKAWKILLKKKHNREMYLDRHIGMVYVYNQRDWGTDDKKQKESTPSRKAVRWRINVCSNRDLLLPVPGAHFDSFHLNCLGTFIKPANETANRDSVVTWEYALLIHCHSCWQPLSNRIRKLGHRKILPLSNIVTGAMVWLNYHHLHPYFI